MNATVWVPTEQFKKNSNLYRYMKFIGKEDLTYDSLHKWSIDNQSVFWESLCDFFSINFNEKPSVILNDYDNMLNAKWFSDARLNYAEHLLMRRDNNIALIFYDEKGNKRHLSFKELYLQVASCAFAMRKIGLKKGDRVAAVMPNMPETIVAMLATSSIGAVWSSCSPDFGYQGIMDRFEQIKPKILITSDGHFYNGKSHDGIEKMHRVSKAIDSLEKTVVVPFIHRTPPASKLKNGELWNEFLHPSEHIEFESLDFDHPLYILFSSGTTGKPKCIVHGQGGTLLQHLKELSLHGNLGESDCLFFYSTCGWMMWNWMVSALALGTSLVLYDACPTYPDEKRLFDMVETEKVSAFGTSAKFLSVLEKSGLNPIETHNLDTLKTIFSTGSPLLPYNYDYVYEKIKKDVQLASISGGTDIISCFALGNPLKPIYRGELQCIGLGMSVEIFDEHGQSAMHDKGELVCTRPFPSMPVKFWNDSNDEKYFNAYFSKFDNVWAHGDYAKLTEHGGLVIYGRSDAILNPGGVRIGTAEIYRQIEKVAEIVDSIVIGQRWQDDVRVILFVKLKPNLTLTESFIKTIKNTIRSNTTPRHVPAKVLQVSDIPRTISGKIVELAVKNVVHNEPVKNLNSLANPECLDEYKDRSELLS
jgi:acetoacetyl-CoA synthetase